MATLMPDQKYPGGYIPPRANSFIIIVKLNGVDHIALWSATSMSGSGNPVNYDSSIEVPVDYNSDTQKFVYVSIPVPKGTEWRVNTYPNNTANNDEYKDNAFNGFEYVPINTNYSESQFAHLPAEGVGINGTYDFAGGVSLSGNKLFVSASGFTNAKASGDVNFWVNASVIIDGNVFVKQALQRSGDEIWEENRIPVGSTRFELPEPVGGRIYSLLLEGGYTYSTPGSPMVMPIPMSTTHEIAIKVRAKSK